MFYRLKNRLERIRFELHYIFNVSLIRFSMSEKRILIIKNDAIGDYIIFRNFVNEIKESVKYNDYKLYILISERVYPIAKELDSDLYEHILLNTYSNCIKIGDKIRFYKQLSQFNFETIIVPVYSPDIKTQEITKHIKAKFKLGFIGDTSNQTVEQKLYYEKYYTYKFPIHETRIHEFEKMSDFFEAVLNKNCSITKPEIKLNKTEFLNAIVFCPGAGHAFRMWPTDHISKLIMLIASQYPNISFIVAVGKNEKYLFNEIKKSVSIPITHYQIQSTLGLVQLFVNSNLVICNDSSAAHIAVASNARSICISNGNNYKRFIPYPQNTESNQTVLLPDLIDKMSDEEQKMLYFSSQIDIKLVKVEQVFNVCLKLLNDK